MNASTFTASRRLFLRLMLLVTLSLSLGLAGCEVDEDADASDVASTSDTSNPDVTEETVVITGTGFNTATLVIGVGSTVTWQNSHAETFHGVEITNSNGPVATLPEIAPGGQDTYTFNSPGVFTARSTTLTGDTAYSVGITVE